MGKDTRVAVVHRGVRRARVPLFNRLSEIYDATFLITRQDLRDFDAVDETADYETVSMVELCRRLRTGNFDVIVNADFPSREGMVSAALASATDTPLVQWTEVWDMPHPTPGERVYKSALLEGISRVADSFVVPGVKWKEYLLRNSTTTTEEVFRAPNASIIPETDDGVGPEDFGVPDDEFVVSYVGRLRPIKRVEDVIKAVARLRRDRSDVNLIVAGVGDDDYTQYLQTLAADLDVDARFCGWVDQELGNLYDVSDLCVAPSQRDAFLLVAVEAMSVGTPTIVSSGVGAANEVVIHRDNGYVVPPGDPLAIYQYLSEFFESQALRDRLSRRAEETINEQVTYERMITGFERAIDHALDSVPADKTAAHRPDRSSSPG